MSDAPEPSTRTAMPTDEAPQAASGAGALLATVRTWWPGWRDVACLVFLVTATFHLVMNDGGRPFRPMLPVLVLGVLAVVAAFPTFAGTSKWLRFLALAWALGPLIAFAFADVRAGWVRPVAAWAVAVPAAAATLHVLRRRWGPAAVAGIVGGAVTLAWYQGLLTWWGGGTSQGEPAWLALSWHDQSGALMAVLGVGGFAFTLTRDGWVRALGVLATVAGLSATWLTGSIVSVTAAGLSLLLVVVIAPRREPAKAVAITAAIAVVLAAAAVVALRPVWDSLTMPGSDGQATQPAEEAAIPVAILPTNDLDARIEGWLPAVRMFVATPLTGTGPGSFTWASRPFYPDDATPTARAHNEQFAALGEMGIVGGGAALGLTLAIFWMAFSVVRSPQRHPLAAPAAGVAMLLVLHAALGFDWDYPILLALLAIASGALAWSCTNPPPGQPPSKPPPDAATAGQGQADDLPAPAYRGLTVAVAALAIVLPVVAATGIVMMMQGGLPWSLDGRLVAAVVAASDGDRVVAEEHLSELRTWNPGAPRLEDVEFLVAHGLGELDAVSLATQIEPARSAIPDQLRAGTQLVDDERPDLALELLEDLFPILDQRRAWGVQGQVLEASVLALSAEHRRGGCDAVESALPRSERWLERHGLSPDLIPWDGTDWSDCDRPERQDA